MLEIPVYTPALADGESARREAQITSWLWSAFAASASLLRRYFMRVKRSTRPAVTSEKELLFAIVKEGVAIGADFDLYEDVALEAWSAS